MPKPPPPDSPFWKVFGAVTKLNTAAFRATRGKIGGRFGKADILLLHHVGAKSGTSRVTPLIYLPDGDDLILVASTEVNTEDDREAFARALEGIV